MTVASGQVSALSRQRLPDGETAELHSERAGLLGQRTWRVQRRPLQVWGVVEELAPGVSLQLVEIAAVTSREASRWPARLARKSRFQRYQSAAFRVWF
jgi:hypothetical protein